MRLIDADALLKELENPIVMDADKAERIWEGWHECTIRVDDIIKKAPTIELKQLPSVQPKRIWYQCKNPPKHHGNVIVRGVESIGNVITYKIMQWDVDRWRPTNYAPSIEWIEWSEI